MPCKETERRTPLQCSLEKMWHSHQCKLSWYLRRRAVTTLNTQQCGTSTIDTVYTVVPPLLKELHPPYNRHGDIQQQVTLLPYPTVPQHMCTGFQCFKQGTAEPLCGQVCVSPLVASASASARPVCLPPCMHANKSCAQHCRSLTNDAASTSHARAGHRPRVCWRLLHSQQAASAGP